MATATTTTPLQRVTAEADSLDVRSSSSTTGEVRLRNR